MVKTIPLKFKFLSLSDMVQNHGNTMTILTAFCLKHYCLQLKLSPKELQEKKARYLAMLQYLQIPESQNKQLIKASYTIQNQFASINEMLSNSDNRFNLSVSEVLQFQQLLLGSNNHPSQLQIGNISSILQGNKPNKSFAIVLQLSNARILKVYNAVRAPKAIYDSKANCEKHLDLAGRLQPKGL
ncbi:uncharacterized protein ASCRUDRAFT_81307 [Ascoidea rubescens DSM 1968]|uniref:Uncharacterized protein n=1 Tax=Ascoidea rubescens DSM 1968 TaxID=1344418 RepID=A0A1D2VFC9_9ASCO|nr:hypothetical protein ASCRUDRAFT_81307 [Ascoidea rubescens DSM 1968]ODV60309.1 hypothetical protein ASCRUDRAFT_81307 [Ascoidea rubescens DSM 1968]